MSFAAMTAVGSVGHVTCPPPLAPAVLLLPAVAGAPAMAIEPPAPPTLAPLAPAAGPLPLPAALFEAPAAATEPAVPGPVPLVLEDPPLLGAPPFPGVLLLVLDEQATGTNNVKRSGKLKHVLFMTESLFTRILRRIHAS